jgi:NAD(P)-dependent dehydrogenase (short-subunit alcohol dehydrogenase family)
LISAARCHRHWWQWWHRAWARARTGGRWRHSRDRRPQRGEVEAAVDDIAARGVKAISLAADVTDTAAVARMVERVMDELGRIDILVNNAGINVRKPPHILEIEEWQSVIDTNLTSAFLCSKAVYPALKAAGGGKIINIGAISRRPMPQARAASCSSRAP